MKFPLAGAGVAVVFTLVTTLFTAAMSLAAVALLTGIDAPSVAAGGPALAGQLAGFMIFCPTAEQIMEAKFFVRASSTELQVDSPQQYACEIQAVLLQMQKGSPKQPAGRLTEQAFAHPGREASEMGKRAEVRSGRVRRRVDVSVVVEKCIFGELMSLFGLFFLVC